MKHRNNYEDIIFHVYKTLYISISAYYDMQSKNKCKNF